MLNRMGWSRATELVRAGLGLATPGEPLHPGPVFATAFHTPGDPATAPYSYARSHNPTWTQLEQALGRLEAVGPGGGVRVFSSGLAAVAAACAAVLPAGGMVVLAAGSYFGTEQVLRELMAPAGIQLRVVPAGEFGSPESVRGAHLVWVETPSNPSLDVFCIRLVTETARAMGALVAVDNTTATPFAQRPLELGADLSVCSDSKALCGHSDLLLGHVAVRDAALLARLDRHRTLSGAVPGPMEAWLALRSLPTLPLRLRRCSENALQAAAFLAARPEVKQVLYPGLPTHAGHRIAGSQMDMFGPVLSFTLRDARTAERFLAASRLLTTATSFGGVTSTAERRARWGHDAVAPGLIRMSAGLEDAQDLLADLRQAMEAAHADD